MAGPELTPEQERLASQIADQAQAGSEGGVDPRSGEALDLPLPADDHLSANLAQLARIAGAHRTAQSLPNNPAPCLFEWRHLKIQRELDHGGFGTVYEAWDPALRRRVALKLMLDDRATEERDRQMIAEAQHMARVRHPNVLAVHGVDSADGRTGIWSDLLDGSTLEHSVEADGLMAKAQVTAMALALTDALALIHQRGIVHGDIKPANIMIQPDNTPVLMDFGSSPGMGLERSSYGSPLVMAPEQFAGKPASRASDIYSLGATLYFAGKGSYPVVADTFAALESQHQRSVKVDYSGFSRRWRALLRRMLSPLPDERPTAAQLRQSLEAIENARPRFLRRLAVALVTGSLLVGAISATLAYRTAEQSLQRTESVKNVITESLRNTRPIRQSGPPTLEATFLKLAELAEEQLVEYPRGLAEMRYIAAAGLRDMGQFEKGLELAKSSLQLALNTHRDSPDYISSGWLLVAGFLKDTGDLDGSLDALNQATAVLDAAPDNNKTIENRLIVLNQLANLQAGRGNFFDAISAHQALLKLRRQTYGDDSIRLAVDYHNIASNQMAVGDYGNAIVNERAAADVLELAGAGDSVRMGFVLQGLAHTLVEAGRHEESVSVFDRAKKLLAAGLPADHSRLQSLQIARWTANYHLGDRQNSIAQLQALIDSPDEAEAIRIRASRHLADLNFSEQRWQAAMDGYLLMRDAAVLREAHFRPFLDVAIEYCRYKIEPKSSSPLAAIQGAIKQMRDAGFDGLKYFKTLLELEQEFI